MAYQQLNFDTVSINPQLLTQQDASDYQYQLNLALNTIQAEGNITDLLTTLDARVQQNSTSLLGLNTLIETYLYTLLSISTISNLDNSQLSPFYDRQKQVNSAYFLSPNPSYLGNLTYSNYKVWGTKYGSLGYYLYLGQFSKHFAGSSELVRFAVSQLIYSLNLPDYSTSLFNIINSDLEDDDYNLYCQSISFLKEQNLLPTITLLNNLEPWLVDFFNWYSSKTTNPYSQGSNDYNAFNLLESLGQSMVQLGIFSDIITNLSYKFVHQEIDLVVLEAIPLIVGTRKQIDFYGATATLGKEVTLTNKLFDIISINQDSNMVMSDSYKLLQLPLNGGMNQWLVTMAAELLNRAYIISHPTNTTYTSEILYPITNNDPTFLALITRIYKLIFYAGHCLKKCDMDTLTKLGSNLRTISLIDDSSDILQEYDLLT